ncbi:MAG: hypothetical protein GY851_05400 [bacterium]|nr:hypothetical protein [bacterium]
MTAKYTARMQFGPHQDSDTIRDEVLALCRTGHVDEVLFFAFGEEQNDGHDTLDRLREWMAAIRPWKQALEAEGIEVSINPWHTVLHCDRSRTLKPGQDWQNMTDWRGRAAAAVVCPLDEGWRSYYAEAMRIFAAERFRVIWVDDDIRYRNHAPLDWGGCWCPLHIAEFNRRIGASASREEIVAKAVAPGTPHPWRTAWFDMWDETHCDAIATWRDIVEAEGCFLGLMSSGLEAHAAEGRRWDQWWPALSSGRNVHRPHFWGYADGGPETLAYGISVLQQNLLVQPQDVESAPEIENFTYGPWNKSYRQITAQMMLAQVFGSDRLAVSLYDFMGNLPSDDPERAEYLAREKPMLAWIGDVFTKDFACQGVGTPWRPDMSRRLHTDGRHDWDALELNARGWDYWLAPFGFAYAKTQQPTVNTLSGLTPWGFSDDELTAMLSAGLLLDGPAAAALHERGFGELIGLDAPRFIKQDDVLYSMEESVDDVFGLRPGAQISLNAEKPYRDRLLQADLAYDAQTISVLKNPRQRTVGHGGVVFENRLGGRIATMPWDASAPTHLCTQRQAQLAKVLSWLNGNAPVTAATGGAWLVPVFMTNGTTWRAAVFNVSPDARTAFALSLPEGSAPAASAVLCTAEGRMVPATIDGSRIQTAEPIRQWECVIVAPDLLPDTPG